MDSDDDMPELMHYADSEDDVPENGTNINKMDSENITNTEPSINEQEVAATATENNVIIEDVD